MKIAAESVFVHELALQPPQPAPLSSPPPGQISPEATPSPTPAPDPSESEISIFLQLLQVAEQYSILPDEVFDASLGVLSTLFGPVDAAMLPFIEEGGFTLDELLMDLTQEGIVFLTEFFFDHTILGYRLFKDHLFALDGSSITALSTNQLLLEIKPNTVDLCGRWHMWFEIDAFIVIDSSAIVY